MISLARISVRQISRVCHHAAHQYESSAIKQIPSRSLATSAVLRKDLVQELYLKELRNFKPASKPADAHVGQVHDFKAPTAPEKPQVLSGADLSKELEAYEKSSPSDGANASSASSSASEDDNPMETADAFLERMRSEAKKSTDVAAHH